MTPTAAAAPCPRPTPKPNTPFKTHFSEKTQDAEIIILCQWGYTGTNF